MKISSDNFLEWLIAALSISIVLTFITGHLAAAGLMTIALHVAIIEEIVIRIFKHFKKRS